MFLAVDPVALLTPEKLLEKPRALAAYAYAFSDPLNNVDADGMEPEKKGFWTRIGQGLISMASEAVCMTLGGCSFAVPAQPGDPIRPKLTPAEIALNLTAAHVAPRISGAIASRILRGGAAIRPAEEIVQPKATQVAARAAAPERVVLGKFPDYIRLADELGAKRFSIQSDLWDKMTPAQQWAANQKFLDGIISSHDSIVLSNPVKSIAEATGSYGKELRYLADRGFKLGENGTRMIK